MTRKAPKRIRAKRPVKIRVPVIASKPVVVSWPPASRASEQEPVTVEPTVQAYPVQRSMMDKVFDFLRRVGLVSPR